MKIKTKEMSYEKVISLEKPKRIKPKRTNIFFRLLLWVVSIPAIIMVGFKCKKIGLEKISKKEPCLFLMNHSSFIDLEIAATVLFPRAFNIICTSDGMIGKNWLMRQIGCIPTNKFVFDIGLVKDMTYAVKEKKCSILMYPEASYSFDGTATPLPESIGSFVKLLGIPVVMIKTEGAFSRDPLYNGLQVRKKVPVSAEMRYIISKEDTKEKSTEELGAIIEKCFDFDNFRWQQENKIKIDEPFRADFLNRVLYKCPHCLSEGETEGKGITLRCKKCSAKYELDEYGYLRRMDGESAFTHIPDWYAWERECVKKEIEDGEYELRAEVEICMLVNTKCIYRVGEGVLSHGKNGFDLVGCDGKLRYSQKPQASYSLYSDFNWYEIGDVICIGDRKTLYYCFPKGAKDIVAKARLATEEMYKLQKAEKRSKK